MKRQYLALARLHNTSGIIVQKSNPVTAHPCNRQNLPRRKISLDVSQTELLSYRREARKGPTSASLCFEALSLVGVRGIVQLFWRAVDTIFATLKYFDRGENIPKWSGFNTHLRLNQEVVKSNLGHLPVLEASPTNMGTIFTILTKSVKIADELEIQYILVIFDMAIYLKAQEIRWADEVLYDRIAIKL